ncbi:DUF4352 domain-containing protein [Thermoflavimicrobium daqui]|uniref:DUF4352 domain-containing protein n=1 Tax=Thermoflavimicrobium daqui TaxID=2137476 RepID=A0A364K3C7_9BACL|nr:DUF4352 domain-containing protein [Thermoflavimicrobium daqui]RAL23323.1 hypothetical protein DL897_11545 [Thermoflavimicrobium daqui]
MKKLHISLVSIFTASVVVLTGCSFGLKGEQPASQNTSYNQNQNNQNQNNQNQNTQNTNQNNQNQNASQNTQGDVGQTKTVGDLTIQVNGVRVQSGNKTSQPKNGKYIVVDASVTNNSIDKPLSLNGYATLKNANGQTANAQYSPYGLTEINYVTTLVSPQSKVTRGVLVFDISESAPYTLEIKQGDNTTTWTINP